MEYCLVPKKIADEFLNQRQMSREYDQTDNVTPKSTYSNPIAISENPTLENLIDLSFEDKHRKYASSVMKYFRDHPLIKFDSEGKILSPVPGINIIDVVKFFITSKGSFFTKEKIKILNDFIKIPSYYIRHKTARNYLYEENLNLSNNSNKRNQVDTLSPVSSPPSPTLQSNTRIKRSQYTEIDVPSKRRRITRGSPTHLSWSSY